MEMTQADFESTIGLTEVLMIRLPLIEWASEAEMEEIREISTPSPEENWARRLSHLARRSTGFRHWLQQLSSRAWAPEDMGQREKLARIDFRLPWCARLRWGAGNHRNVDIFVHATGGNEIPWETIR